MPKPGDPAAAPSAVPEGDFRPHAVISSRQQATALFLDANGWRDVVSEPLARDASFRSYWRLRRGRESIILMDAPPPHEDVGPYVAVSEILRRLGLSAPAVWAQDRTHGFLLIEDFGDDTYTRLLAKGGDEPALYTLAVDTLVALQRAAGEAGRFGLPRYDEARLLDEAALLVDWYLPAVLGERAPPSAGAEYRALWRSLLPLAGCFRPTLVLRDFHVDNLMMLSARAGIRACGLLDFQDAVIGAPAYDLVSLLEDARRDLPEDLRQAMTERYLAAFPQFDRRAFMRSAAILAAQRNCKIIGIFTRLCQRDGKPGYLRHIPRVWKLLDRDLHHPALGGIADWLDRHIPAAVRTAPQPGGTA